ncbi:hypothetical protein TNCV_342891 [Trichonephila clavipes]|nr:hypothetical protein TNCV_342891 [Trichonephila clavipes]
MKITPLEVLRIDADKTLRLLVAFPVYRKSRYEAQSFRWGRKAGNNSQRSLWLEVEGNSSGTERRTSAVRKCEGVSVDMHPISESLT